MQQISTSRKLNPVPWLPIQFIFVFKRRRFNRSFTTQYTCKLSFANKYKYGWGHEFNPTTCWIFFSVNTQKDVVGITRHVVTTISAFSFTMLLLDRILTHIVNHLSNTSYHFQYLYYPGGNETGAKPNLITCITEIFLSAVSTLSLSQGLEI